MELMERRMCEGWTENQQQFVELISRQNQLSGSVHSLADQLASLSVEHRSWLISTRSVSAPLNFSDHSADLQEEIIRMRSEITNPIIRRMFETGVKSATASHLEKMTNEQPMSQKARWSGREEPNLTHRDVVAPPNLDSNISNQWSREVSPSPSPTTTKSTCKRRRSRDISPSPNTTKSICRRRRIRRGFRNTTSINEFFGGTIYIRSDTYEVGTNLSSASNNSDILETETAFIYHPAAWLLRRCFAFGVRALVVKAAQGWKYQLSTFRAVPDNSLIFEFCEDGNLEGVRSLLARREASPWDVNSLGGTPLHVSCLVYLSRPFVH